jgi:hypothetical protein
MKYSYWLNKIHACVSFNLLFYSAYKCSDIGSRHESRTVVYESIQLCAWNYIKLHSSTQSSHIFLDVVTIHIQFVHKGTLLNNISNDIDPYNSNQYLTWGWALLHCSVNNFICSCCKRLELRHGKSCWQARSKSCVILCLYSLMDWTLGSGQLLLFKFFCLKRW